ncbi:pyridoxamine 5'-phosphate oxidase family protein [Salarchaeum sp. JOR-1]|nr:pyridoxamine 5'-phosphate oxidase family protein [Salarchaeum sp. JOR-1]
MDTAYTYTTGLSRDEIEERLAERTHGTLSLCRDGAAYGVPLNHRYEDGALYFRFANTPDSTKKRFLETTERASYVVYDATPTAEARELDSWSVHATGPVTEVEADPDPAGVNDAFAPFRLFDEPLEDVSVALVRLDCETLTGRETPA